jgi:hypothetical protein
MSYEGWTNWETWLMYSFLTDDNLLDEIIDQFESINKAATYLKENIEELYTIPEGLCGVYESFIRESLIKVNWHEIVKDHATEGTFDEQGNRIQEDEE